MNSKLLFSTLLAIIVLKISLAQKTPSQQDLYQKIEITANDPATIQKLVDAGIDLRCGVEHSHHGLTLQASEYDLNLIKQLNIPYNVLEKDVFAKYIANIDDELKKANTELKLLKAQGQAKSSISSASLDNFLQYQGCAEIDWATPSNYNLGSMGGGMTVQEAYDEMDDMRALYPNLISQRIDASPTAKKTWGNPSTTITNNGLTYQGIGTTRWNPQSIYYVRITGDQNAPEGSKPQILYTSMIHAREVSSLMGNMFFMWYLLENYATDPAIKNLVDNNELYFIPVVNPDGLRWNEHLNSSGGGMQRKNLRPGAGGTFNNSSDRGVDLNRNFDYFWGSAGSGSSGTTTSDSYRGPSAFSEPETQILRDFILARSFKTALWHHSFANGIPHPYGGNPTFVSGREDEMHKWHEDMTKYNRYVSGATIFTPANGIADDWMLGGNTDANGSNGSGQNILATTPEHGHGGEGGFWPTPSNITPIAKRAVRMNFMNAYYGGAYATFHDLTQSDINSLNTDLKFGIERIGQTPSDFTITLTPVSSNIVSITSPATETGMSILEQRELTAQLQLDLSIQPNEKIEFVVKLENNNHVFYEANMVKYYQPTVLLNDNPDVDGSSNWTIAGDWAITTADAYTGNTSLRSTSTVPYPVNANRTLTTANTYDFTASNKLLVQFYTKWDIERNYDFATIQASTNGSTWVNLCGRYTKPNSTTVTNDAHGQKTLAASRTFQSNNSGGQVYDGDTMDRWVMEEIVIDANNNTFLLNNSNVQFRFLFRSDGNDRPENYSAIYDGFYIDDFKIIGITEVSDPPVAVCQDITVNLDENGTATITGLDIDGGSTDDFGITGRSVDISSFSCSDVGNPVTVTLTVTDANGQTDQCTATVTVVDAGNPVPDLASLPVIDSFCIINLSDLTAPTATDACDGQITATTSTAFPITTSSSILWEFTDSSGNTSTQSQTVSIPMPQCLPGGLSITNLDTRYVIDFDNTLNGVNNGQFSGNGFTPNPNPGQLNSEAFEILGLSGGPSLFGGTQTGGSFANGTSNGFTNTAGIFAFQVSPNNHALGVQPANNEFNNNGTISLRIKNNTSSTVNRLLVGYTLWINNDQNRSSTFNLSHSSDNVNLIAVNALNTPSILSADANGWTAYYRVVELTGLNIAKDNTYFLHWVSNDSGGSGSRRDEFAIDDIHVVANPTNTTPVISGIFKEVLLEGSTTATAQTDINEFLILNSGQLFANGLVTLKSNDTKTAIIPEVLNGSVSGAIEVERYIPARRAFRFLSSPVTTTNGIYNNWQESGNNTITNWGTQITGSGGAVNGFDASGSNNPSMFGFDNSSQSWTTVSNTLTTNLTAGTPYRIMVRGDRSVNLFSNASPPTNTTLRAKGTLHIGDYVVPSLSSAADGFNFIGNPYQASVDMQLVLTEATNIKNSFYTVWDPTINTRGGYVTVDVVNNSNPVTGSDANKFLQPGQAAFVQTNTSGAATLTFKEVHKDNAIDYVAVFNQLPEAKITLNLFNTANSNSALDAVQLRFSDVYYNSIDQYDAGKIYNQDETFALSNNSNLLSIESRALPMSNDTIPLFTDRYRFVNYKLELKGESIIGFDAYLWDDYEKVLTAIPANTTAVYSFDIDASIPESMARQRFYIITSPQTLSVDPFDKKELIMYPNPVSNGQVFIEAGFNFENAQIQVYNALGQEVFIQKYSGNSSSLILDVQRLASGNYMLKISDNTGLQVIKKLIVR